MSESSTQVTEHKAVFAGVGLPGRLSHMWDALGAVESSPYSNGNRAVNFGCCGREAEHRAAALIEAARDELPTNSSDEQIVRRAIALQERGRMADAMHHLARAIQSAPQEFGLHVQGSVKHILNIGAA